MKKLSFFTAAIFIVSFSFAQNTTTLNQIGGNQNATIDQTGANSATVNQSTDDGMQQNVDVTQKGTSSVTITQLETGVATNGYSIPVQTATVNQDGLLNTGEIIQNETGSGDKYLSKVILNQKGNENQSVQKTNAPQSNSGLTVIGLQTGDNNKISQDITSGYTEYFKTEQIGNSNEAVQTGSGSNADGTIYQKGDGNKGTQTLSGMNNGYYRNGMLIQQIGDNNESTQDYWGSGYNAGNSAEAYQSGDNNKAYQTGSGHHFTSIATQMGDYNEATINQNGTASPLLVDNSVELLQTGNENKAAITQELGSTNTIKLMQSGGGEATLLQQGNSNIIKGLSSSWAIFNSAGTLDATQVGDKNSLSLEADGSVSVMQNNSSVVSASGNMIEFSQADGGSSALSQKGDENLIKLTKTGGGDAEITQDGMSNKVAMFDDVYGAANVTGSAMFNGSSLNIDQTGNENLINLNSTSAGAVTNISQFGDTNKASVDQH